MLTVGSAPYPRNAEGAASAVYVPARAGNDWGIATYAEATEDSTWQESGGPVRFGTTVVMLSPAKTQAPVEIAGSTTTAKSTVAVPDRSGVEVFE